MYEYVYIFINYATMQECYVSLREESGVGALQLL